MLTASTSFGLRVSGLAVLFWCLVLPSMAWAQTEAPPSPETVDPATVAPETSAERNVAVDDTLLAAADFLTKEAADQEVGTTILRTTGPGSANVLGAIPPVWVDRPTMKGVRAYEALFDASEAMREAQNTNPPDVGAEACPAMATQDLAEPAAFDRASTLLPPGQVTYFYSEPDSLVQCAVYRWDEASTMTGHEFIRLMKDGGIDAETVLATYDVMFEEVVRAIERRLGTAHQIDHAPVAAQEGNVSYRRSARWTTDDVVIDLRLTISRIGGHLTVVQNWPAEPQAM